MPRTDILGNIESLAGEIVKLVASETDDQQEGIQMLSSIRFSAQGIIEKVNIMRKYREIKNRVIYLYYPQDDVYQQADRNQKIKIARRLLMKEGKLDLTNE